MESLPQPAHLEIRIDEWQVAHDNLDAVDLEIRWRGAREDSTLGGLLTALPPRNEFVPIRLVDGRTELAFKRWQRVRFGKGPPIFASAQRNYEAWAGRASDSLPTARRRLADMIRQYVPNFDDYTDTEQVDFIMRTQDEVNAIHDSVEALIAHLEYAEPGGRKSVPRLKNPRRNVQAAVFCDVMRSSRRAGELLGIPLPPSDQYRDENQRVRKMADRGRELLYFQFGEAEWETKAERMHEFWRWWEQVNSLDDHKQWFYTLLAKASGTSPEHERLCAEKDGFERKLDEWIAVVESRLKIDEIQDQNIYDDEFAWPGPDEGERRRLLAEQGRIEETDERFAKALSIFDAPPDRP